MAFLSPWRSLCETDWRFRYCCSRITLSQLTLKAGRSVAGAFEASDYILD